MNGQIAFQMLIQNFEGLVETHGDCAEKMIKFVSNPFSYILAMNHLCSMQQAERMKCSHFLLPVEFLCSSHSFLSGPLSLSLSLSLKRVNALPTHIAADVMLFPGIGHQQGNVNAERQIRCTLTSVQSHAVITSSSVCESKTTRLIISYNTLQSPRRQRESDAFKEMLLCISPPLFMELCKMILLVSMKRDQKVKTLVTVLSLWPHSLLLLGEIELLCLHKSISPCMKYCMLELLLVCNPVYNHTTSRSVYKWHTQRSHNVFADLQWY